MTPSCLALVLQDCCLFLPSGACPGPVRRFVILLPLLLIWRICFPNLPIAVACILTCACISSAHPLRSLACSFALLSQAPVAEIPRCYFPAFQTCLSLNRTSCTPGECVSQARLVRDQPCCWHPFGPFLRFLCCPTVPVHFVFERLELAATALPLSLAFESVTPCSSIIQSGVAPSCTVSSLSLTLLWHVPPAAAVCNLLSDTASYTVSFTNARNWPSVVRAVIALACCALRFRSDRDPFVAIPDGWSIPFSSRAACTCRVSAPRPQLRCVCWPQIAADSICVFRRRRTPARLATPQRPEQS